VPYTLLLADDSVTIQRVIELTFADEDVTVVAVSDGDQAIERLEASPPDIVLADIGMPGKNGYEVAQYIRRSPKLSHIPVVLLTGAFEPVDQARANEAGCDGVLAKPFEPQLVIGRVKELLARGRRAEPSAPAAELNLEAVDASEFSLPPLAAPVPDNIWAPPLADQRPVTPFTDPPLRETQGAAAPKAELNDYFDRLDAAFSTLSSSAPAPPAKAAAEPPAPALETAIDWFGTTAADKPLAEPWDVPAPPPIADDVPADFALSYASPQPAIDLPDERLAPIEESAPIEPDGEEAPPASPAPPASATHAGAPARPASSPAAAVHEPVPAAPALELPLPNPPPLPALPDAFAALLAAEQNGAASELAGTWPASPAPDAAVGDEVIEEVTRRVLDRLSDTVVRDAVADVASKIAERLIREEIARIKASIK
jgi:CheY-like chemotaxis protein